MRAATEPQKARESFDSAPVPRTGLPPATAEGRSSRRPAVGSVDPAPERSLAQEGLSPEQPFDAVLAQALRTIADRSNAAAIEALVHAQHLTERADRDELRAQVAEMRLRRRA